MQLCETTRESDGAVRYYVDSKRVTQAVMRDIKSDHRLDTFLTRTGGGYVRQFCCATKIR